MSSKESPSPIELARRERGWRQQDLAAQAGVSRHTVALSERGYRPSEATRRKIASALRANVPDLWPGINDHEPWQGPVVKEGVRVAQQAE
jgi:DNA-binding XRE family transcriptional regulator